MATSIVESGKKSKGTGEAKIPASMKPAPATPPEVQLKRFLYLNQARLSFVTGNPEKYDYFARKSLKCIEDLLSNKTELFFNIIEIVSGENLLPRRDNLFYALALAATYTSTSADVKARIYRTVLLICKSDAEFFAFVRYYILQGKNTPTGLNKCIARFYLSKEPIQLAKDITEAKGYKGWRHADLIKLSHAKTTVKSGSMVMTYILYGLEKAQLEATSSKGCQKVLRVLTDATEYRKSKDEQKILKLLPNLKCFSHLQLQPILHKSLPIWNIIYERYSLQKLLFRLLFFYKNDYFNNMDFLNKIIERITNAEFIQESKIHPIHVFIAKREFEKGGKTKDPKLIAFLEEAEEKIQADKNAPPPPNYKKPDFSYIEAPSCPTLKAALHKTLTFSYCNVQVLGKHYLIAIEVSDEMNEPCLRNKNITCLEAAVIIALSIYRAEKNVTVGVFNGAYFTQIEFEKGSSFRMALEKVKKADHDYVAYGRPIDWAILLKKQIDVFMCLVHNIIPRRLPTRVVCNPAPALDRYHNKKETSPNTKLILHSLNRSSGTYFDSRHKYILNLHGFDENIAPLTTAFLTDKF